MINNTLKNSWIALVFLFSGLQGMESNKKEKTYISEQDNSEHQINTCQNQNQQYDDLEEEYNNDESYQFEKNTKKKNLLKCFHVINKLYKDSDSLTILPAKFNKDMEIFITIFNILISSEDISDQTIFEILKSQYKEVKNYETTQEAIKQLKKLKYAHDPRKFLTFLKSLIKKSTKSRNQVNGEKITMRRFGQLNSKKLLPSDLAASSRQNDMIEMGEHKNNFLKTVQNLKILYKTSSERLPSAYDKDIELIDIILENQDRMRMNDTDLLEMLYCKFPEVFNNDPTIIEAINEIQYFLYYRHERENFLNFLMTKSNYGKNKLRKIRNKRNYEKMRIEKFSNLLKYIIKFSVYNNNKQLPKQLINVNKKHIRILKPILKKLINEKQMNRNTRISILRKTNGGTEVISQLEFLLEHEEHLYFIWKQLRKN